MTTELITEMSEFVNKYGGENTVTHLMVQAIQELRRLQAENEALRVRVDSTLTMVEQSNKISAELLRERDALRAQVEALSSELARKVTALVEWFDKTDWLAKSIKPHELGKHRADVLRERVETLNRETVSAAAFDRIFALNESNAARVMELEDQVESPSAQEPFAWLVCSINNDGSLSLEHAAQWREAAHEHINDAITEHEIEGAAKWVVRPVYLASPQAPTRPAMAESYDLIDRFLRNNLGDDDYAEYSNALDVLAAAPQAEAESSLPADYVEVACALIKAADDLAADRDYMLDSNDCIKVLRGQWAGGFLNDQPQKPKAAPQAERCTSCDGTGDLIDMTGEWLGYCVCEEGRALKAQKGGA